MQFNITFKTIFEYVLKKIVLCIQIRFVSTEKTTRITSRASCYYYFLNIFRNHKVIPIAKKHSHTISHIGPLLNELGELTNDVPEMCNLLLN